MLSHYLLPCIYSSYDIANNIFHYPQSSTTWHDSITLCTHKKYTVLWLV